MYSILTFFSGTYNTKRAKNLQNPNIFLIKHLGQ